MTELPITYRISLAMIILAVWYPVPTVLAQQDRYSEVVARIEKAGGEVTSDKHGPFAVEFDTDNKFATEKMSPEKLEEGLSALEGLAGIQDLSVSLSGPLITDDSLKHLRALAGLAELTLYDSRVTDAGLAHLAGLKNLKKVVAGTFFLDETSRISGFGFQSLRGSNICDLDLTGGITDAGMSAIARLPNLRILWLRDAEVTDAGISRLRSAERLQSLFLYRNQVQGQGFADLARLPDLKSLTILYEPITNAGFEGLCDLRMLRELVIEGVQFSDEAFKAIENLQSLERFVLADNHELGDEGLGHLGALTKLSYLELSGPPISDALLPHLSQLKKLQHLRLIDTSVSDAGVQALRKSLEYSIVVEKVFVMGCISD